MGRLLELAILLFLLINSSSAYNSFVNFGECSSIYDVTEDHSYEMSWNGNSHFYGCKVTFHGYDDDHSLDEYKICVKATIWNIQDSGVTLQYYSGDSVIFTYLSKTFSKNSGDPTYKWCSSSDDYVDIKLTTSSSTQYQGSITLEVTAVKTFTYFNYGGTIGGAVGGFICIIVVIVILSIICRRRSYIQRTTYAGAAPSTTIVSSQSSQQFSGSGGISNPGYPTGPVAPPAYNSSYPGAPHPAGQAPPPTYNNSFPGQPQQNYPPAQYGAPAGGQPPYQGQQTYPK